MPDISKSLVNFQAGLMGDVVINKIFSLQPSVLFSGKGAKYNASKSPAFTATARPYYIEIPINFVAKYPFPPKSYNFFLGAGPYIAFGVSGKREIEGEAGGTEFYDKSPIKYSSAIKLYDFEEYAGMGVLQNVDYGYNVVGGIRYKRAFMALNYSWGIRNIQKDFAPGEWDARHRVFSVVLGYKLL